MINLFNRTLPWILDQLYKSKSIGSENKAWEDELVQINMNLPSGNQRSNVRTSNVEFPPTLRGKR